jgi:hypothetical protein
MQKRKGCNVDIADVTRKDLFQMKLRDEAIVVDASEDTTGRWVTAEDLARLWSLGVLAKSDSGQTITTHRIISYMRYDPDDKVMEHEIPAGKVLGPK